MTTIHLFTPRTITIRQFIVVTTYPRIVLAVLTPFSPSFEIPYTPPHHHPTPALKCIHAAPHPKISRLIPLNGSQAFEGIANAICHNTVNAIKSPCRL